MTVGGYDEYSGIDPSVLAQYFGSDGPPRCRRRGQTGAGHSEETDNEDEPLEDESDGESEEVAADDTAEPSSTSSDSSGRSDGEGGAEDDDLVAEIIADQQANIRHAAVKVARRACPFHRPADEASFWGKLDEVSATGFLPRDMGIRQDEWGEEGYPASESLTIG